METQPINYAPATQGKRIHLLLIIVVLSGFIIPGSFVLYSQLSHPRAQEPIELPPLMVQVPVPQSAGGLDVLAERLKRKLERNPDNGEGWALLARSYVELDRHDEAIPAFEQAVTRIPDDAQLLVDYADALGMVGGRKLDDRAIHLIQHATTLDSKNVKAQLLGATVAYDRKQYDRSIQLWEQALRQPNLEPSLKSEISANIAEARNRLSGAPKFLASFSSSQIRNPRVVIKGTVSLASRLKDKVSPQDTLFVFARSVNGPPMPVAVVRTTAKSLPYAFQLDDSNSVMPGNDLSEAGEVVVMARLSKSGGATPHAGDLEGKSSVLRPGPQMVELLIDTEIP